MIRFYSLFYPQSVRLMVATNTELWTLWAAPQFLEDVHKPVLPHLTGIGHPYLGLCHALHFPRGRASLE